MKAIFGRHGMLITGLLVACGPLPVAAKEVSFGRVSHGTVAISVSVAERVRTSAVGDVRLAVIGDATPVQSFCLWSNTGTRRFSVTAHGSGPSGAFTLGAAPHVDRAYGVRWRGAALRAHRPIQFEAKSFTGRLGDSGGQDCADRISLVIPGSSASSDRSTSYSGILTIVVAPD